MAKPAKTDRDLLSAALGLRRSLESASGIERMHINRSMSGDLGSTLSDFERLLDVVVREAGKALAA